MHVATMASRWSALKVSTRPPYPVRLFTAPHYAVLVARAKQIQEKRARIDAKTRGRPGGRHESTRPLRLRDRRVHRVRHHARAARRSSRYARARRRSPRATPGSTTRTVAVPDARPAVGLRHGLREPRPRSPAQAPRASPRTGELPTRDAHRAPHDGAAQAVLQGR